MSTRALFASFFTCPWSYDVKWRDTRPSSQQMTVKICKCQSFTSLHHPRLYTKRRQSNMVRGGSLLRFFGLFLIIFLKQGTVSSKHILLLLCRDFSGGILSQTRLKLRVKWKLTVYRSGRRHTHLNLAFAFSAQTSVILFVKASAAKLSLVSSNIFVSLRGTFLPKLEILTGVCTR